MPRGRWLLVLALLCSLVSIGVAPRSVVAAGVWLPAGALQEYRAGHTASLLPDGTVLVTGGAWVNGALATSERYDPATNSWRAAAALGTARVYHTTTNLAAGRVLVTGGGSSFGYPSAAEAVYASAELYDPATDRWTPAAPMSKPREHHTATLLKDGRVLVVGGVTHVYDQPDFGPVDATAEIYDPATNSWSPAGTLRSGHYAHSAVLLNDGQVLVVGGWPNGDILSSSRGVERYGPATNSWSSAENMLAYREQNVAVVLTDGSVLVTGGHEGNGFKTAERYDPATDHWTSAGVPGETINPETATLLPNGQVLVTGGFAYDRAGTQGLAALYDPQANTWAALPEMRVFRGGQTATLLQDGRVLVAGGGTTDLVAELYVDESTTEQCFPETGKCLRGTFLAYWLSHGGLAVNGYPLTDEFVETLENGKPYTVQYLERVRLEAHPEASDPRYQILLGQFGRSIHPDDPAVPQRPGAAYFTETGHNLEGGFLTYWNEQGGLDQFGFPISEVFSETLEDGKTYQVQYFERARFELHPENRPPFDILLGQFGRRVMAQRGIQP
jgi:N-acetylneuraminic acid mutarotase